MTEPIKVESRLLQNGSIEISVSKDDFRIVEEARRMVERFDYDILRSKLELTRESGGGQRIHSIREVSGRVVITHGPVPDSGGD